MFNRRCNAILILSFGLLAGSAFAVSGCGFGGDANSAGVAPKLSAESEKRVKDQYTKRLKSMQKKSRRK